MTKGATPDWNAFAPAFAATWLLEAPEEKHRRRTGCLVSADLSGFTAMSERLASMGKEGAERLTSIVNGCFEALISTAAAEGGDVLKFGGDALLIWFDGEDGAERGAYAATRMQRAIGAAKFAKLGMKMSVGAHFDEFDMFLVGDQDWRELVLAGKPVTRTVDLEGSAEAGQIVISSEVAARLPATWPTKRTTAGIRLDVDAVPTRRRKPEPAPRVSAPEALVAPGLREELRALAGLGGEHRIVSVVFLEVEGTDDSLEEIGPDRFALRVDALVRSAEKLQAAYGVQFLYTDVIANGIKLIATAGAPTSTVNDDEAALRYAVDIVHGDPLGRLKGGVNRGRVFAGFLGAAERRTYTVMGDPVNLAARLMARAEPGQVVVSTEVVDGSRAGVKSRALPPFLVKGKAKPVSAVIVDEVSEARRTEAAAIDLPLIGREQELALLRTRVGDVAEGRGHAIELVGDAGIGKSRLVQEVGSDERIFGRVTVECQPYDLNTAYAAAKVVLRRVLGIPYSATPEVAGQALSRTVARVCPHLVPLLPLLAVPVDATVPPTAEAGAIANEFVRARTHDAMIDLLTVMVATPTLLLIEDAYYADPASAALFSAMAAAIGTRPWLLVVTSRPEMAYLLTGSEEIERLVLEPLPAAAAAELAAAALRDAPGVPADVAAAAERAGGNPLFVLRLMEALSAGVATEDLPESVERIVAERLDRLTPVDRTLLRYAAVLGARFDADLLGLVLASTGQPDPDPGTWERLTDLVEVESKQVRRFRHVLYRDVAYEGLPFGRRGRLHQQIGELLEASHYASDVSLLAEHFFRAGDHERTWRYSVAAGDQAWRALAVREAAAAYQRALKVRPRIQGLSGGEGARVAELLGDALERNASYDEADAAYRTAARLAAGRGPVAEANLLLKRGVLRERTGQYAGALRWYERGRAGLEGAEEDAAVAALLVASAGVMHRIGRIEECFELARNAADRAVAAGDTDLEAHACLLLTDWDAGAIQARRFGKRALRLFTALGDVLYQGKVHNNLGIVEYFGGDWTPAAEQYTRAAERFDAAGDVVEAASARNNLGEVLSDQGHVDDAIEMFEHALAAWTRASYPIGRALALSNLGRAQARAGHGTIAVETLTDALTAFEAIKAGQFVVDARLRIAEAHLLLGDPDSARSVLDAVAEQAETGGFPGADSNLARLRCWQLRQEGRPEEALVEAQSALALAERSEARVERALALNEIAQLSRDRGAAAEVADELAALGIVSLPALPVPL